MTIRYVDFEGGNDANDGSSFALRKKTLSSATTGLGGGDEVRVMASPDPVSMGVNGTWTDGGTSIALASAVTAEIDPCEVAWTAAANVTTATDATWRATGTVSSRFQAATAFTTGLMGYNSFAAKDLSAYRQISLLVYVNSTLAAGTLELKLCSDAAGTVVVNSIALPRLIANFWTPVVVDTGGALGASIQSVALYATVDPVTTRIHLDNIIACKAPSSPDALTHKSLIGKGTAGEPWFAVKAIEGTTVHLSSGEMSSATYATWFAKYYGTGETVAAYRREAVQLSKTTSDDSRTVTFPAIGTTIAISGGWNRTDMSTQTGMTWIRPENPSLIAIFSTGFRCVYSKLGAVGCATTSNSGGFYFNQGDYNQLVDCEVAGCYNGIVFSFCESSQISGTCNIAGVRSAIVLTSSCTGAKWSFDVAKIHGSNSGAGAILDVAGLSDWVQLTIRVDEAKGFTYGFGNAATGAHGLKLRVKDSTWASINTEISLPNTCELHFYNSTPLSNFSTRSPIWEINPGGVAGAKLSRVGYGTIETATDQRHTASGVAWKMTPYNPGTINSEEPLVFKLAKIPCLVSEARTVKLWVRRSHATDVAAKLVIRGGFLAGVPDDIESTISVGVDTWEQLSVTFTPTEAGVAEAEVHYWSTTSSASIWIDDLSVE